MKKQIAFDIETAKDIPGDGFDWKPHRPLGISCIATLQSDQAEPEVWHSLEHQAGEKNQPRPASRMSQVDVAAFVRHLIGLTQQGYSILTWNGLSFDFDVLAEESGMFEECKQLAREHVDMMFHIVCEKGFPVGLDAAAKGLDVSGKLSGVAGVEVPKLWASGEYDKVLEYVKQDARITLEVAQKAEQNKKFQWKTRKGTISSMPLLRGWLTVEDALELAEPDTSWMTAPKGRKSFLAWMDES